MMIGFSCNKKWFLITNSNSCKLKKMKKLNNSISRIIQSSYKCYKGAYYISFCVKLMIA